MPIEQRPELRRLVVIGACTQAASVARCVCIELLLPVVRQLIDEATDQRVGQQHVVVKSLEANCCRVSELSGAPIVGGGRMARRA